MPGGFHPFHAGHAALYNSARRAFPGAEVFVAATNDTSNRPFPFAIKEKLAKLAGVEPGHFVQVKSPFQAREITAQFNPEQDKLIFVRSEKDADKPPQAGGVKKDGTPAYLQPLEGATKLEPFGRHAYMAYLPTVEFGPGMTSATEIRTAWPTLNEKRKTALVMSLYPKTQANPKLAATVVKMLDTAMGGEGLNELRIFHPADKPGRIDVYYRPGGTHSSERRVVAKNIPYRGLDLLTKAMVKKFGIGPEDLEIIPVDQPHGERLDEFAPDEGGESRKFIPWNEFVDQLKQILHKDFDCKESINMDVIKAKFVPYDPMEYGPTMIYSYFERRAGRKGANGVRGQIQVGNFFKGSKPGDNQLMTGFHLLKGTEFERYFDLTFDNLYKIANIIKGNTQGALQFKPEGVAEMDAQNMVGGMTASYQERENQPVAEDYIDEKWSQKYKNSINCANPKGFSQKAHCAGRKK
jgi:hypothetical protein